MFFCSRVRPPLLRRGGGAGGSNPVPRPKGALPPFAIFSQERRASLVRANPQASVPEIGKMLGEAWHALTELEKNRYRHKAKLMHNVSC